MFWAYTSSAAAHTVTCTFSSSIAYASVQLLDYSGTLGTINNNMINNGNVTGNIFGHGFTIGTSGSPLTTSQRTLIVHCSRLNANSNFIPGVIAGNAAHLRSIDSYSSIAAPNGLNTSAACQDYIDPGAETSGIWAVGAADTSFTYVSSIAAFNY